LGADGERGDGLIITSRVFGLEAVRITVSVELVDADVRIKRGGIKASAEDRGVGWTARDDLRIGTCGVVGSC
jgi:hypothetical protein